MYSRWKSQKTKCLDKIKMVCVNECINRYAVCFSNTRMNFYTQMFEYMYKNCVLIQCTEGFRKNELQIKFNLATAHKH